MHCRIATEKITHLWEISIKPSIISDLGVKSKKWCDEHWSTRIKLHGWKIDESGARLGVGSIRHTIKSE
eukprot:scaffold829_cov174-Ochromonas_danica.AAC.1